MQIEVGAIVGTAAFVGLVASIGCAAGPAASAPVVWSPAQLRRDGQEAVLLTVRNATARPICGLSIGASDDGLDVPSAWIPHVIEGGRLEAGAEFTLETSPGTLVVRVQVCEGPQLQSERRLTSPNQRIRATVERL